jgi:hypothetical protein
MSWYYNRDLKPLGPLSLQEMRQKIFKGEVSPQDLIFNEELGEWKPALEWKVFEASLFPALQGQNAAPAGLVEAEWILLREVQEGPYRTDELQEMLRQKKINGGHYIWKTGLSGWVQIKDRPEFAALAEASI